MLRSPCSKCGTIDIPKYIDHGNKSSYCIMCHKEHKRDYYYEVIRKHPEMILLRDRLNKEWQKRNKEYFSEYRKKWERLNAADIRRRKRAYYLNNIERIKERNRLYKLSHKKKTEPKEHPWRAMENARIEEIKDRFKVNNIQGNNIQDCK